MTVHISTLPTKPTNIIFTGIAGTGKTHQLLHIQSLYDEVVTSSWETWRIKQIKSYSWCDVICAVLLTEDRMMTVPEMVDHHIIQDKMVANGRSDNISQTLWGQLNLHAHPESVTVNSNHRSANYFFDKNDASQWYLLDEIKASLNQSLGELLSLYDARQQANYKEQHTISRTSLVSFHQAYGYEEFVEGIRPQVNPQTGQMQYEIQSGAFLALCDKALADPDHRYAMLIDEINRANTAQVFGELMSVIEPSKRAGSQTPMSVRLAYSGRLFSVPSNVDIYATMNTQDYSLATLDTAFRRRFEFITCLPDSKLLPDITDDYGEKVELSKLMLALNRRLSVQLGNEAQLGHAYFMDIDTIPELAERLYKQIIPHIEQQLKINMANSNVAMLMSHILYGDVNTSNKQDSLLDNTSFNSDALNPHANHITSQLQNNESFIALSEEFLSVVDGRYKAIESLKGADVKGADVMDANVRSGDVRSTDDDNDELPLFLKAKPYQKLYDSQNNAQDNSQSNHQHTRQ